MSDKLRPTEALSEATDKATNVVVNALPWLQSFSCPDCGGYCNQTYAYSPDTAAFDDGKTPAWKCRECGKEFYREEDSNLSFDPFDK